MWRFAVEKNEFSRNRKSIQVLVFLLFFGVLSFVLSAQPTSIEQAKRTKIDTMIKVAKELVGRGMYQQAQVQLNSLQTSDEYVAYLSESHTAQINTLLNQINQAISERSKIAETLGQSEQLIAEGKYRESVSLLTPILNSLYATEQERQMISETHNKALAGLQQEQQKWQALYDQSVQALQAGRPDEARQGFAQVASSGYQVQGSKSADEYIASIDAQAAVVTPAKEFVPIEITVPTDGTATTEVVDQEIEPADLLPAAVTPSVPVAAAQASEQTSQERSYIEVVRLRRAVQLDYTRAIVEDAVARAEKALEQKEFEQAKQALRRAFSTVESNKMLLEDALYTEYTAKLTNLEQRINESQGLYEKAAEVSRQQEADKLTAEIRQSMDKQREAAVKNYMERAYAFIDELRFEEALGQLEQLLAIDPLNQQALMLKRSLEHNVRYIEQRRIQEEANREELDLLLEADRRSIPFSKEMTYPRNWKEIASRREELLKKGMDPADIAVNELLNQTVDLSGLTENTTFQEAIEMMRVAVDPP
jgi:tetratricopeptide (TPR) repeat protein